tara:strand:- start:1018 stop:1290 length:273 start_codon:yes stop_codon:yes gene_type:complete
MRKMVNNVLVDMTTEEIAARQAEETAWANGAANRNLASLREERDRRLAETDYLALSDNTITSAQTTYRQALRDITDNATSLDDVTWPTKP